MKRLLIGLLALLTMGSNAMAVVVTVPDVEAVPGETVSFSVSMSEGIADTYTAMTLYAQFPITGFTTTGASVNSSWTGATYTVGDIDGSGLATIPFASPNAIPGTAVDNLVTVSFTVDAGVALGDYDVTLKATKFEWGTSGDYEEAADVTFQVHVVSVHTVVLDENSTVAPIAATDVNVTVKRTINANEWSTICLPFAMTTAQVKEAFGNDVELADFTGVQTIEDGSNTVGLTVNFSEVTAIEANHPYIIKVSSAISEFTVDGVTIYPQEASVDKDESQVKIGNKWYTLYNSFVGTYVANTTVPENMLFLNSNNFYYSVGSTIMKGYRAYFDFYDVLSEVENASVKIYVFVDEEETKVEGISTTDAEDGVIYDLNGRRVSNPQQHGVYIVNGKKVLK